MNLQANRDCGCGCGGQMTFRANLLSGARRETFRGKAHLVVPLVMLRQTVVNGAFVPLAELKPQGWNGSPVTIGHPEINGALVSANAPQVIEQWQIGTIFNAKVEADKLKAEAWIDIDAANAKRPGIIDLLEGGEGMDVSTGYFADSEPSKGVFNGKSYVEKHFDLKPDHLALLPDEQGACSWEDGCGVRANKGAGMADKKDAITTLKELLGITGNERGKDDDYRQMIADLISNDSSPFIPDDEYALREMSYETLKKMRDAYVGEKPETNSNTGGPEMAEDKTPERKEPPVTNEKTEAAPKDDAPAYVTADDVASIVTNAIDKAMNAQKRVDLVERIHANTEIDKAELEAMSTASLEKLAVNHKPKADYSGRGIKTNGDTPAPKFPEMASHGAQSEKEAK